MANGSTAFSGLALPSKPLQTAVVEPAPAQQAAELAIDPALMTVSQDSELADAQPNSLAGDNDATSAQWDENLFDYWAQNAAPPSFVGPQVGSDKIPDTRHGAYYHAAVGWYFPAIDTSSSNGPVSNMHRSHQPVSYPSSVASAVPSRILTPAPRKPKGKQRLGPAHFFEEQERNRVGAMSSAPIATPLRQPSEDGVTGFARKAQNPQIIQVCICDGKEKKVPRPRNPFILYRCAKSEEFRKRSGTNRNQDVSKMAGRSWANASSEEREYYYALAREEEQKHREKYPNYRYKPGQGTSNKFGTQACTCGAYQKNLAANKSSNIGNRSQPAFRPQPRGAELVLPEYQPFDLSAAPHFAPVAQVVQPGTVAMKTLNSSAEHQSQPLADWNEQQHKRDASAVYDCSQQPPTKRRSARNVSKAANYAESAGSYIIDDISPHPFDAAPTTLSHTHDTRLSASPIEKTPISPSHTYNTRSRSIVSPLTGFQDLDWDPINHNLSTEEIDQLLSGDDFGDMFREQSSPAGVEDSDAENTVVVATPRRRSTRLGSRAGSEEVAA